MRCCKLAFSGEKSLGARWRRSAPRSLRSSNSKPVRASFGRWGCEPGCEIREEKDLELRKGHRLSSHGPRAASAGPALRGAAQAQRATRAAAARVAVGGGAADADRRGA